MPIFARLVLFGLLALGLATIADGQNLGKLPYVPTPQIVVDEMLKLAGVAADDFVIDLGSGDGRIVIGAATQYNAAGFGVDIDPKLVALSNKNAKAAGVSDRVQFFERDMFKTDISKASVLMLYVLPDFMARLRAKVLKELRPGARVVAHDYYMAEWHPDRMVTLKVPEKIEANGTDKAYLYLWIVPATVKGNWRLFFDTGGRTQELNIILEQEYQMLSAAGDHGGKPIIVEKPTLKGNEINFALTLNSKRYQLTGTIDGDRIEGKALSGKEIVEWRARKMP
jgi:16S rRNA G966 N2-methylase RsmD